MSPQYAISLFRSNPCNKSSILSSISKFHSGSFSLILAIGIVFGCSAAAAAAAAVVVDIGVAANGGWAMRGSFWVMVVVVVVEPATIVVGEEESAAAVGPDGGLWN